jgi:uncharacterized protein (DUF1499 family)
MGRRFFIIATIVVGVIVTALLVAASTWPVINVVETGKTPEYPEIQPQYYSTDDPVRVYEESKASVEELERFELVESDPADRVIRAEATTSVFGFVDDVTIRIEPVTEFVTRVHVRSASRVGKGDFGQNARNIEEFFEELDSRLGAVKFDPRKRQKEANESQVSPPAPSGRGGGTGASSEGEKRARDPDSMGGGGAASATTTP